MTALFSPINRRGCGIRWQLISYTALMFSFVTVFIAVNLDVRSISYIDNHELPGVEGVLPPGPLGYQSFIPPEVLSIVPSITFLLNYWLADGLLLYRCYVIYSMNLWVIAFPCLMYLASVAMGIMMVISWAQGWDNWIASAIDFGRPYFAISISFNLLLTLMIVGRLVLHGRRVRAATGSLVGISGLYQAIVTMLIESSALYNAIAPLLITRQIATQSASTSNTAATGRVSSFRIRGQGDSTDISGAHLGGGFASLVNEPGKTGGLGIGAGVETTIDLRRDKV